MNRRYRPPPAMLEPSTAPGYLVQHAARCAAFARHVNGCDTCARASDWFRPDGHYGPPLCATGSRLFNAWDNGLARDMAPLVATPKEQDPVEAAT